MKDTLDYPNSPELAPKPTGQPTEQQAPEKVFDNQGGEVSPYDRSPGMTGQRRYGDGRAMKEGDQPTQPVGQRRFTLRYRDGREVPIYYPDLRAALRSGAYLDFRRSILDNQVIELSQCHNQDFTGASMRGAQIVGTFTGCNFLDADLRMARLSGTFEGCEFNSADFDGATIAEVDFSGSTFQDAKNLGRTTGKESARFALTDVDVRDLGQEVAEPEEEPEPEPEEVEEPPEEEVDEYEEEGEDYAEE